jgi:hypothetical protein
MKNLFLLPTEKPSRLWINNLLQGKLELSKEVLKGSNTAQHIYITSDEEIKEGDYFISGGLLWKANINLHLINPNKDKKIILTTDQDLIKDGVQPIPDEFLEWFVKNPSCEFVELKQLFKDDFGFWVSYLDLLQNEPLREVESKYKIIIPKDEPKQETLEEVAYKIFSTMPSEISTSTAKYKALELVKWQQEQDKKMYSEEEVINILNEYGYAIINEDKINSIGTIEKWFKQFKNK